MPATSPLRPEPRVLSAVPRWPGLFGLRARMLAGFVGVALFTGCLGLFALTSIGQINAGQKVMRVDEVGGLDLLTQFVAVAYDTRIRVVAYLLPTSPEARATLRQQIAEGDVKAAELLRRIDAADVNRSETMEFAAMSAAWDTYKRWRDETLLPMGAPGDVASARAAQAAYDADGVRLTVAMSQAIDDYLQAKRVESNDFGAAADATYDSTRNLSIWLTLLAVAVALGIGHFQSKSIARAVGQAARAARGLSVGKLDQHVDVRSNDELGALGDAVRAMIAYQREMASVARSIAEGELDANIQPRSADDELGVAIKRMSRNLRAMVQELEEHSEALASQAQLLDLANDAIIVRDPETASIRYWNHGAEELYGWGQAEAIGRVTHDLLQTQFPQSSVAVDRELEQTGRWTGELVHTCRDGRRLIVLSRQAIQRDAHGRPTAVLAINTDVTQRHEAEAALALARDVAEAASYAKSEFLANTSHEIRTPMNAILGMAELLAETPLTDEQREYVETFQRAGETLLALIDDLLDLSKIESGQLELERIGFDLGELVEHTADVLAVRAHAKGLELAVHVYPDVETHVVGDPNRLRQVLTNLLGNAIKFTERGEVGLRVERDPRAGGNVVSFAVWDTGMGIPFDKQAAIFDSFVQADASTTRRHGGTGLGLAISRRIVELMGGELTVTSEVGQGSTFHFSVPLDPTAAPIRQSPSPAVDIRGWRVLVADDNATNRLILHQFLSERGAVVVEASDGSRALAELVAASARRAPFQLVLLDGRMPGLDGLQVAARLRDDPGLLAEMVIMLTSDSRGGDVARARELGLGAHLIKPIKRADLIRTIAEVAHSAPAAVPESASIRAIADHATPAGPPAADTQSRPLRLLLVEDSADNRRLIKAYLKKLPYQIEVAEDGQVGVTRVREGDYDLVLMDMLMPVMDGLEATRAIRRWEREAGRPPTPIVALSANAMEDDVRRCLAAGCDAHLAKPVKKAALLAAIDRYAAAGPVPDHEAIVTARGGRACPAPGRGSREAPERGG